MDEHSERLENRILDLESRIEKLEREIYLKTTRTVFDKTRVVSTIAETLDEIPEDEQPEFWKQSDFWLNKVGVVLLLISMAYFFSYSIEQDWLNAFTRVIIGVLSGFGLFFLSYWVKQENDRVHMAELLKGATFGIFYLSIYASYAWYDLIGQHFAAILTMVVTITAFSFALVSNKELIAIFAIIGAYISPFILSSEEPNLIAYLTFISIVTASSALLALYKVWRNLGSIALYFGWMLAIGGTVAIYDPYNFGIVSKIGLALCFLMLFISTGPIHFLRYEPTKFWYEWDFIFLLTPLSLVKIFALIFEFSDFWTGVLSISIGGLLVLWAKFKPINEQHKAVMTSSGVLLLALGSFYLFESSFYLSITVMSGVLSAYISREKSDLYKFIDFVIIAGGLLASCYYLIDSYVPIRPFLNIDSVLFLAMIGTLIWYISYLEDETGKNTIQFLTHILILAWISAETDLFTLSTVICTILWILYVVGILIYSVRKNEKFARLIAILSLVFILAKLFLVDMDGLDLFWRFVLLASVGGFLMLVSYVYKRLTES